MEKARFDIKFGLANGLRIRFLLYPKVTVCYIPKHSVDMEWR